MRSNASMFFLKENTWTEGINMEAVMEAVTKDFNEWLQMERNMTINDKTYTEEKQ